MVNLLEQIHRRKLREFSDYPLLLGMMTATASAPERIKGLLPAAATVAHKPGTNLTHNDINGATNDVGIITVPGGKRHILLAVYLKGSRLPKKERDSIVAQTAKAIYDVFTGNAL